MNDGNYTIELTDPVLGERAIGTFTTHQHRCGGQWFATGYVQSADGSRKRSYGCSRDYDVEAESIDALLIAECATHIIWR